MQLGTNSYFCRKVLTAETPLWICYAWFGKIVAKNHDKYLVTCGARYQQSLQLLVWPATYSYLCGQVLTVTSVARFKRSLVRPCTDCFFCSKVQTVTCLARYCEQGCHLQPNSKCSVATICRSDLAKMRVSCRYTFS